MKNRGHIVYVPVTDCLPHRLAIHTPRLINDIPSGGMSSGLYLSLAPFLPARGKVKWKTEGGGGGRDTSRDRLFERSTFLIFPRLNFPILNISVQISQRTFLKSFGKKWRVLDERKECSADDI